MNSKELENKDKNLLSVVDATAVESDPEQGSETDKKTGEEQPGEEQAPTFELTPVRKFPDWMDLLSTAGVVVFAMLLSGIVLWLWRLFSGAEEVTPVMTFVCYLVQMLPIVAYVFFLRHRAKKGNAIIWGVKRVNPPMVLWGVLLLLASSIVIEPLLGLFSTDAYDAVTGMIGLGGWAILSTVVAAPLLEEILFRGLIFESCRERFGRGAAVLVSALLFGLIHVVPVQMINAFVVGLILGYIYLKTNSLLSVIILHAINNAIAYLVMALFGESANMTLKELISQAWLYWVIYALAAALFVFAMLRLYTTLRDNTDVVEE